MSSVTTFYHYTSRAGLQAILDSGVIQKSNIHSRHAHFGEGVYGTSLPPRKGRRQIALNNWGHEYPRRVERAIQLTIPTKLVKRVGSDRDILLHDGQIVLDEYEWEVVEVPAEEVDDDSGDGSWISRSRQSHRLTSGSDEYDVDDYYYDVDDFDYGDDYYDDGYYDQYVGDSYDDGYYDQEIEDRLYEENYYDAEVYDDYGYDDGWYEQDVARDVYDDYFDYD